jgi:hypothetical protein
LRHGCGCDADADQRVALALALALLDQHRIGKAQLARCKNVVLGEAVLTDVFVQLRHAKMHAALREHRSAAKHREAALRRIVFVFVFFLDGVVGLAGLGRLRRGRRLGVRSGRNEGHRRQRIRLGFRITILPDAKLGAQHQQLGGFERLKQQLVLGSVPFRRARPQRVGKSLFRCGQIAGAKRCARKLDRRRRLAFVGYAGVRGRAAGDPADSGGGEGDRERCGSDGTPKPRRNRRSRGAHGAHGANDCALRPHVPKAPSPVVRRPYAGLFAERFAVCPGEPRERLESMRPVAAAAAWTPGVETFARPRLQ